MPGRIDAYVSQAHYAAHLQPILDALPDDRRGRMHAPRPVARTLGYPCVVGTALDSAAPLLVGGFQDLAYSRRPKVLVQHGAGQTYDGVISGSFAGGPAHDAADLFICPSQRVADLEATRYPGRRYAVVGCPKLDAWARIPKPDNAEPVVAVTFHWNQHVKTHDDRPVPEAGWAWPDWPDTIADLARRWPGRILGHCHPRAARDLAAWWPHIGVEYVPDAATLLARADVLILDNSSLGFEWAALDRPTVWLRGAAWRVDGAHGAPRFGMDLGGPELEPPVTVDQLVATIDYARFDGWAATRARVAGWVYDGLVDGHAADRAAAAVIALQDE